MVDTAALGAAGPKAMRRTALPSSVLASCGALVPACSRLQPPQIFQLSEYASLNSVKA